MSPWDGVIKKINGLIGCPGLSRYPEAKGPEALKYPPGALFFIN